MPKTASDTGQQVLDMIRREIMEDPEVSTQALYEQAVEIDESISDLNLRQFHAKYPLQVKRSLNKLRQNGSGTSVKAERSTESEGSPNDNDGAATTDVHRAVVRDLLVEAVEDLGGDETGTLSEMFGRVDAYVTRIINATS